MKIVIFSDSHGDVETMCGVVEKEKPDMIIYLGDGIEDAEQLNERYSDIQMIKILGNVDSKKEEEWIKFAEICGKRFIMTHGHIFINEFKNYQQTDENRITSRNNMLKIMAENNADILLHGHTHDPYINKIPMPERICWIMNPGSISRIEGIFKPTYGILKINESGTLEWRFIEVD